MRISSFWGAAALVLPRCAEAVSVKYCWKPAVDKKTGRVSDGTHTASEGSFRRHMLEKRDVAAAAARGEWSGVTSLFSLGTLNCWKSQEGQSGHPSKNAAALVVNMMLTGLYDVLCVQRISRRLAEEALAHLHRMGHRYELQHMHDICPGAGSDPELCMFYNVDYVEPLAHFVTDSSRMPTYIHLSKHRDVLVREGYFKALSKENCVQGVTFMHRRSGRCICVQNVLLEVLEPSFLSFCARYDVLGRASLKNADVVHYLSIKNARMYATEYNENLDCRDVIYFMAGDFCITEQCYLQTLPPGDNGTSILYELMCKTRFSYVCEDVYPVLSDGNVGLFDTRIAYNLAMALDEEVENAGATGPASTWHQGLCPRTDQVFYGAPCRYDAMVEYFQVFQEVEGEYRNNSSAYKDVQVGKGFVFRIAPGPLRGRAVLNKVS